MRQLNISKQPPDPAWAAENAHALPLLRQLAAARPLGETAAREQQWLRFIVSVATQYRGQGAPWESLLAAGYAGLADCYDRYIERLADFVGTAAEYKRRYRDSPDRWASWWVRQRISTVAQVSGVGDSGVSE